jgi:hypothetical protein
MSFGFIQIDLNGIDYYTGNDRYRFHLSIWGISSERFYEYRTYYRDENSYWESVGFRPKTFEELFGEYPLWYMILSFLWITLGLFQAYNIHLISREFSKFQDSILILITSVICVIQILTPLLFVPYQEFSYIIHGYFQSKPTEFGINLNPIGPVILVILLLILKYKLPPKTEPSTYGFKDQRTISSF